MKRTLTIFILLCLLVLNILFCEATKMVPNQIQILNPNQNRSGVMNSDQFYFKQLSYLLIYPTPTSFKYCILPYLPSANVIKMYEHFRNFYPKLNLEKWFEGFIINPVIDFTDSFEKKILFRSPYQFLSLPILFSQKTKFAITIKNFDFKILPDNVCAFLESTQKIFPFFSKSVSSHQTFLVADDPEFGTFFVYDEQFLTIAHGKVSDYELQGMNYKFRDKYVKQIWKAKNLKGWKKIIVAVRYSVTIPYIKYLQYISPFLDLLHTVWLKVDIFTETECHCIAPIVICIWLFIRYLCEGFIFHTITLPFHALALFSEMYLLEKKYFSLLLHCALHLSLFLPYSLFFPKFIDGFLQNSLENGKYVDKIKFNSFSIEPKNKMWPIAFFIPRKRMFEFYIWVVLCEFFLSLILQIGLLMEYE